MMRSDRRQAPVENKKSAERGSVIISRYCQHLTLKLDMHYNTKEIQKLLTGINNLVTLELFY
jgi:hypothetical protein